MIYHESVRLNRQRQSLKNRAIKQLTSTAGCIGVMVFILLTSAVITYCIVDPMTHPNLHPRMVRLAHYMQHYHPRLTRVLLTLPVIMLVISRIGAASMGIGWRHRFRSKGRLLCSTRKIDRYLGTAMKEKFQVLFPMAWQNLKDILPGLYIKVPGMRGTHWELLEQNENRNQMRLALLYVHDPLGLKASRLYPRKLRCTVTLKGRGVHSETEIKYSADSAMDYDYVRPIIEQTNAAVKEVMLTQA